MWQNSRGSFRRRTFLSRNSAAASQRRRTMLDMKAKSARKPAASGGSALRYLTGFGNEHASEAVAGALPVGQNSPQKPPLGLYPELLSGTAFTAPPHENRRSWLYRVRPSAMHPRFERLADGSMRSGPFDEVETPPNRLRWDPLPLPDQPSDFVEGLATM